MAAVWIASRNPAGSSMTWSDGRTTSTASGPARRDLHGSPADAWRRVSGLRLHEDVLHRTEFRADGVHHVRTGDDQDPLWRNRGERRDTACWIREGPVERQALQGDAGETVARSVLRPPAMTRAQSSGARCIDASSVGLRTIGSDTLKSSIRDDCDGVREVEASDRSRHRDAPRTVLFDEFSGKAHRFAAEQQYVSGCERAAAVRPVPLRAEEMYLPSGCPRPEGIGAGVLDDVHMLPVVESGATHGLVVRLETQRMHQMQPRTQPQTKTPGVAGVWPDFRMQQGDVEDRLLHQASPTGSWCCPTTTRAALISRPPIRYPAEKTSRTTPSRAASVTGTRVSASWRFGSKGARAGHLLETALERRHEGLVDHFESCCRVLRGGSGSVQ